MSDKNTDTDRYAKARRDMVGRQLKLRGIKDKAVLEAMGKVRRELFIPDNVTEYAYEDRPLPIGMEQTISQPYIVALMTESLELDSSMKVLEIGTGSGYQAAVLAEIAGEVYSVEINEKLCRKNKVLLSSYKNLKLSCHDGTMGWEKYAPYDRILVTAAPVSIPPAYTEQLRDGGIMVIPVGASLWSQELLKIIKTDAGIKKINLGSVAFVPLLGEYI